MYRLLKKQTYMKKRLLLLSLFTSVFGFSQYENTLTNHYRFNNNLVNEQASASTFTYNSDASNIFTSDMHGNASSALRLDSLTFDKSGFLNTFSCSEAFTISMLTKITGNGQSTSFNDCVPLIFVKKEFHSYFERILVFYKGNRIGIKWANTLSTIEEDYSFEFSKNVYYHIAVTFSQYEAKLYINGDLASTITKSDDLSCDPGYFVNIGKVDVQNSSARMDGIVDEIRFYSSVLTESEINEVYQQDITDTPDDLSTNKLSKEIAVSLYPNPTNTNVTIENEALMANFNQVEIVDIAGNVLNSIVIESNQVVLPTNELSTGIYFAKLNGAKNKVLKFEVIK